MTNEKKLTIKQAKFLNVYFETGNGTEAAMQAYDCTREVARRIATENLSKPDIKDIVRRMMEERGLTIPLLIDKVKDAADGTKLDDLSGEKVPDHAIRLKAVQVAGKWLGLEKEKDYNNLTQINIGEMGVKITEYDPNSIAPESEEGL